MPRAGAGAMRGAETRERADVGGDTTMFRGGRFGSPPVWNNGAAGRGGGKGKDRRLGRDRAMERTGRSMMFTRPLGFCSHHTRGQRCGHGEGRGQGMNGGRVRRRAMDRVAGTMMPQGASCFCSPTLSGNKVLSSCCVQGRASPAPPLHRCLRNSIIR